MYKIFILALSIAAFSFTKRYPAEKQFTGNSLLQLNYRNPVSLPAFFNGNILKKDAQWSAGWMNLAQENIRRAEYNFKWEDRLNAYSTPNRKNNLRFYYSEKGFSVEPRTTRIAVTGQDRLIEPSKIRYRPVADWKIKFSLDGKQVGNGKWQITNNTAAYITDQLTVQYFNNEEGMRQNFIVHSPPPGKNDLSINFSIKTKLKVYASSNRLRFFNNGAAVLHYEDLQVWDARGRSLPACFKKTGKGKYCIRVNTKGAVYPITIDPLSSTPAAIMESNLVNAFMGAAVSAAGDVNGDGFSDVIVGASEYDNGQNNEGAAFIFHGSATGINTVASTIVESNQADAFLGYSVASAGDVNGDGYSDVVVGAHFYDNGQTNEGAAFVYHGSATGINATAVAMLENNQADAQMGNAVGLAGDVNGDGYSDVIVGAWFFDSGQTNEGAAFVYHGSASGINTAVAAMVESNQATAQMGVKVGAAGDVNGDGYSDIIIGAFHFDNSEFDEGAAFIYHGSAAGINTAAAAMIESNQAGANFGASVATAGDVNGDGYSDVIAGAPYYSIGQTNEGAAFVYHGSASGINTTAVSILESNQDVALLGVCVASAGDVNGDGYSDVIVGANGFDNGQLNEGAAFFYQGSPTGINITAAAQLECDQPGAEMGICVASAGDVNGDGYSDVIVGAPYYSNGENNEGAAFSFHGSAAGINISFTSRVEPDQANANLGYSVSSAGDVNADGFSDVVVGVPNFDNSESNEGAAFVFHGSASGINSTPVSIVESNQANANLGFSVACAGDVNGDGYSDIIVGAPNFDLGQTDEGCAFVYHGSAGGIITAAAATLQSNQANASLGYSVSGAGDVNGDGYNDVIAGAYRYDNTELDEGAVFVYQGSATGINTAAVTTIESNQVNAYLGYAVSGAGSVNADGFSDIIAGAPLYDNGETDEGAVFVYHGAVTGVNAVAAAQLQSNQTDARLGFAVSGAGDVNGDGFADVIAGAYNYDNGQTDEGAAFVYHGTASGINTTAAAILESNQTNAYGGYAVSNAGDVNGDGYADVIVGAYNYDNAQSNEGAAFIYHGSPAGVNIVAAAMIECNQVNAILGNAVAGAGDVNGDGYSDVIIGAYGYDNGSMNEGAAFVHLGNNANLNKRNNLRFYNSDLVTPINSSNFIMANFGAGLFARSFLGRGKGKLVWETRLNYNAYSGTPITNSVFFTGEQSSYTDMGLTGLELRNSIDKLLASGHYTKLRARIKYDPLTALTGQVYSPWRNVSSVIDANSLGALPLDLISFNAAWLQKGRSARLNFSTDKEAGTCCFDIEKSSDGFRFHRIGTVQARNAGGVQQYDFIDNNAVDKKQFYRLKIKGIAGQYLYSNIQQLQHNGNTEILVFPNPATDILHIRLNGNHEKLNISIINAAGQVIKQISSNVVAGQTLSIPVNALPAGRYWLHLQSGNEKQVLQFVKR